MEVVPGLEAFLVEQPRLRLQPLSETGIRVCGEYVLFATNPLAGEVMREFQLMIEVPLEFPARPPIVFETGGSIPKSGDFHVNQTDFSLCLGSHIGLRRALRAWPNLQEFFARTLRPYLYAVATKLESGGPFVFGELRHGLAGTIQDLADDLGISEQRLARALEILTLSEPEMLRASCPCGCGRLLSDCDTNKRLLEVSTLESREWFQHLREQIRMAEAYATANPSLPVSRQG